MTSETNPNFIISLLYNICLLFIIEAHFCQQMLGVVEIKILLLKFSWSMKNY